MRIGAVNREILFVFPFCPSIKAPDSIFTSDRHLLAWDKGFPFPSPVVTVA
jgi:hypothetical protein